MSESFYYWEDNWPKDIYRPDDHECFVTKETIRSKDDAYWTDEFNAWISTRGYQMIENAQSTGEIENNPEWQKIYSEWYAKDQSIIGREEMWHSEWMSKMQDDAGVWDDYDYDLG